MLSGVTWSRLVQRSNSPAPQGNFNGRRPCLRPCWETSIGGGSWLWARAESTTRPCLISGLMLSHMGITGKVRIPTTSNFTSWVFLARPDVGLRWLPGVHLADVNHLSIHFILWCRSGGRQVRWVYNLPNPETPCFPIQQFLPVPWLRSFPHPLPCVTSGNGRCWSRPSTSSSRISWFVPPKAVLMPRASGRQGSGTVLRCSSTGLGALSSCSLQPHRSIGQPYLEHL